MADPTQIIEAGQVGYVPLAIIGWAAGPGSAAPAPAGAACTARFLLDLPVGVRDDLAVAAH